MTTGEILKKLVQGVDITVSEATHIAAEMMNGDMNQPMIAAILTALATKGEKPPEVLGFIKAMRNRMTTVELPKEIIAIDTCGTGGDGSGTFNISTAVALVTAGAGIPVAKHGNRAASSKSGSADVLEALEVPIDLTPEQAAKQLSQNSFAFLFAPQYHPAVKHVVPVRKELGIRTIFNYIGPFCNPAGVTRQIVGMPSPAIAETMQTIGAELGYDHIIIISGTGGVDEAVLDGETVLYEYKDGVQLPKRILTATDIGIQSYPQETLCGGSAHKNAEIITALLQGAEGPPREIVLLNAGLAIYVSGTATTIEEGITRAAESIDSGAALHILQMARKAL